MKSNKVKISNMIGSLVVLAGLSACAAMPTGYYHHNKPYKSPDAPQPAFQNLGFEEVPQFHIQSTEPLVPLQASQRQPITMMPPLVSTMEPTMDDAAMKAAIAEEVATQGRSGPQLLKFNIPLEEQEEMAKSAPVTLKAPGTEKIESVKVDVSGDAPKIMAPEIKMETDVAEMAKPIEATAPSAAAAKQIRMNATWYLAAIDLVDRLMAESNMGDKMVYIRRAYMDVTGEADFEAALHNIFMSRNIQIVDYAAQGVPAMDYSVSVKDAGKDAEEIMSNADLVLMLKNNGIEVARTTGSYKLRVITKKINTGVNKAPKIKAPVKLTAPATPVAPTAEEKSIMPTPIPLYKSND